MTEEFDQPKPSGISRRTVTKAMAWSVPAIALAAPAPAFALSLPGPTISVLAACKQPGNSCFNDYQFIKGYVFLVRFQNTTTETIYLYTDPLLGGVLNPYFVVTSSVPFQYASARFFTFPPPTIGAAVGASTAVAPGATVFLLINAGTNSNSANTDAIGTLSVPWGHTATAGDDPNHPYTPAPPTFPTGSGWITVNFNFASTPPCDDCLPEAAVTPA